jgi:hypothetical protein
VSLFLPAMIQAPLDEVTPRAAIWRSHHLKRCTARELSEVTRARHSIEPDFGRLRSDGDVEFAPRVRTSKSAPYLPASERLR